MKNMKIHKPVKNKSPFSKKSAINMQNKSYLKKVKVKKKGGYPRGTRKGSGGLAMSYVGTTGSSDGGMGESTKQSFKDYLLEFPINIPYDEVENEEDPVDSEAQGDEIDVDDTDIDVDNTDVGDVEETDPNKEGLIRRVQGAHLVYKRQNEEGNYEELWIYRLDKQFKDEVSKKKAILAGTDIDLETGESEDGMQKYDIWTAGDAQLIHITGLPN